MENNKTLQQTSGEQNLLAEERVNVGVCVHVLLDVENARSDYYQLATSSSVGAMEQSQKLRSLHQEVDATGESDQDQFQYYHNHTAVSQTRGHYDRLVMVESEPNAATSLLRRNANVSMARREYGTTSSAGSRRSTTFRRNILRLKPALLHRLRRDSSTRVTPPVVLNGDRRNEFFSLKRLIFMTLGMPTTPAISTRMQNLSSKCFKQTTNYPHQELQNP